MVKELFHYTKPGPEDGDPQVLLLKLGEQLRTVLVTNRNCTELYYLSYNINADPERYDLPDFEKNCSRLSTTHAEIRIVLDLPNSLLVPRDGIKKEEAAALLNDTLGHCSNEVLIMEEIPGRGLKNIYTIPGELNDWLNQKFPGISYHHVHTLACMSIGSTANLGTVLADFGTAEFTVVAMRNDQLLLVRSFSYETPQDVVYHLLNLFKQFSLSQPETELRLSGLIDKDSALYKELYQYFIGISFRDASWNEAGGFPAHYFTSFNDLAKCAS